jgi:hypothetical protein
MVKGGGLTPVRLNCQCSSGARPKVIAVMAISSQEAGLRRSNTGGGEIEERHPVIRLIGSTSGLGAVTIELYQAYH